MNRLVMILLAAFAVAGCRNGKAEHFDALPFPDMSLPAMMDSPQDRAEYMAEHFWDVFTDPERAFPSDSLLVSGVRKTDVEQKFANWIQILDLNSPDVAEKAVKGFMTGLWPVRGRIRHQMCSRSSWALRTNISMTPILR